jgi:hypothetical protein
LYQEYPGDSFVRIAVRDRRASAPGETATKK